MNTTYDPKITALLCIDFYNDFLSEGGKPHLHPVVAVEGLLDESVHETSPNEDECGGHGADHGKAEQHIHKVEELRPESPRHEQRNEYRPEERRDTVEDERRAVDEKENRRGQSEQCLHDEVAENLNRSGQGRHGGAVAGGLHKLEQIIE